VLGGALAPVTIASGTASAAPGVRLACRSAQLAGTFATIVGSAGAGNVSYSLRLRNHSTARCFVSGLVGLQLRGGKGAPLPTNVVPAQPGAATAVLVSLAPGASAWASARFSPDVPGKGEPVRIRCEATAYTVRVTVPPRRDSLVAPVVPPTPVCEHGRMLVSLLGTKRPRA